MDPVGVYTTNGVTSTYVQPGEGTEISTLPSIRTPASSSCTTYDSSALYAAAASLFTSSPTSPTGTSGTSTPSGSGSKVTTTTSGKPGASTTSPTSKSTSSGAADRRVDATNLKAMGIGMGPFMAIAASVVAGFGAILAGL